MYVNTTVSGLYTEPTCVFGYNADTKTPTAYQSYWSSYTSGEVRYAVRFLDTQYCSVWKYQIISNKLVITAKIIDKISSTDTAMLSAKLAEIMGAGYDWTTLNEDIGEISRTFYACGWGPSQYMQNPSGSTNHGQLFDNWSATHDGTRAFSLHFDNSTTPRYLLTDPHVDANGASVRLFRDY